MALTIAAGEQSDADVLRKVRRGDRIAYGLLYSRHVGAARRLARGILGRRPEADDVVAEVFASTLAALDGGRGPVDAFAPYLLSSVRYECYRVLRRDVTGEPVEHDALDRLATAPASRPAGRDAFARVDEDEVLQQAFATLSSRQRAVLWHTEVDGLSHESIAAMTGSTPRAVSSLALRARQALGDAYLQAHVVIPAQGASDCADTRRELAAVVRGSAGRRCRRRVADHLATCAACTVAHADLQLVNDRLRTLPIGAALGVSTLRTVFATSWSARWLGWLAAHGAPLTVAAGLAIVTAAGPAAPGLLAEAAGRPPADVPAARRDPVVVPGSEPGSPSPATTPQADPTPLTQPDRPSRPGRPVPTVPGPAPVPTVVDEPPPTEVTVPDATEPDVPVPDLPVPDLPDITVPDLPDITVPDLPDITVPDVTIPDVTVPAIPPVPLADLPS